MLERHHTEPVDKSDTKTPPSIAELSSVVKHSGEIGPHQERESWILGHFTPEELAGLRETMARIRERELRNEISASTWSAGHGAQPAGSIDAGFSIPYFHGGKNGLGRYIADVDYQGSTSAGPGQTHKPLKIPGVINRKSK